MRDRADLASSPLRAVAIQREDPMLRRVSHRLLLTTVLIAASAAPAFAQIRVEGSATINVGPTSAPPAPRAERARARRGWVWVGGRYEWRNGAWVWQAGRWERERRGKRWRDGRWEERHGRWEWVDGRWDEPSPYPTSAPPSAPIERPQFRRGFVWVSGRYEWRDGAWAWQPGRWEREQRGRRWRDGRWDRRDDRYEWVEGSWEAEGSVSSPPGVVVPAQPPVYVGNGPTTPPPAPRAESAPARAGYVWIAGRYDWRDGAYQWIPGHWERERANQVWNPGRWELRGGTYVWIEGRWGRR
jgi:hypothetical protein